ncbi:MAG: hypothetical protein ABJA78_07200 [Ferruginibacter sp.]
MKYFILLFLLPCCAAAQVTEGFYSDTLKDDKGRPVANCLVQNKVNTYSVYSDIYGCYEIKAKENDSLCIYTYPVFKIVYIKKNDLYQYAKKYIPPIIQYINPIVSTAYSQAINTKNTEKNDGQANSSTSETNYNDSSRLRLSGSFLYGKPTRKISIRNNKFRISNAHIKKLTLSGNYSSAVENKIPNRQPALQQIYAQGRSENGKLIWSGAENGELFSYGPLLSNLEFDGSNYLYDSRGRLTAKGNGNGTAAKMYDNSILRNAMSFSQSLDVQGNITVDQKKKAGFETRFTQTQENSIVKENKNSSVNLYSAANINIGQLNISGSYNLLQESFSNSNRNGFLNRVYLNALLTPVSFENGQGPALAGGQRTYSNYADNPYYLLDKNKNAFKESQQNFSLVLDKKQNQFNFNITQTLEKIQQNSDESLKINTANFENGFLQLRKKSDLNYTLKGKASYTTKNYNYEGGGIVNADYVYTDDKTTINYLPAATAWRYQRSASEFSAAYSGWHKLDNFSGGINISNRLYFSSSSEKNKYFLPAVSGFLTYNPDSKIYVKTILSLSNTCSELPVNTSFGSTDLLQYNTGSFLQYAPGKEVRTFDGLTPINNKEGAATIEITYKNKYHLTIEGFTKKVTGDIYPIIENLILQLKNIADHKTKGVELQLWMTENNLFSKKIYCRNGINFYAYKNKVTHVEPGYDYTSISGFSNVHKAIVNGAPWGVIVGNNYLYDNNNNRIIGADGFPLVNNNPTVIGDPNPDFIIKQTNSFVWKAFTFNIDLEWKKGGDVWNGTQALLDYYGRSENSAALRNTTNYIFAGVLQNGQPNNIPVSFYDPRQPVEKNFFVRYGSTGIAANYIQKGDYLKINTLGLSYKWLFRKYIRQIRLGAYVNNIIIWTAYKGVDPNQLLMDQPNSSGLDFFNLPSTTNMGLNISIQF